MNKYHPQNERIKRRYLIYLKEAKGKQESTIDQVAAAIADFEKSTKHTDFKKFRIEQAKFFKEYLARQTVRKTGKPLSVATVNSRLLHVNV